MCELSALQDFIYLPNYDILRMYLSRLPLRLHVQTSLKVHRPHFPPREALLEALNSEKLRI